MLKLKNIVKTYEAGDSQVEALKGVSLNFRRSEFVSVLGPSGCGKTTLLNIIGGLDQYTSGDLIISGRSTKKFRDHDWDGYRNHSVGFVFQSYNLIPHQTVLANVELALTLSGVSKQERRRRAIEALRNVGLEDQLYKKPNQMSGGQMQRVAIARALVNDPEILLADEPTGALDSTTSVQIMEILKEIAKNRLVIMVTHNPELADQYSTRIIRLLDGKVVDDSAPYEGEKAEPTAANKKAKKPSMSFLTALSLSLNNLMTKKGRTVMISFAGSIGIIGIALILSVSTGVQSYINRVQEDTLSSYPITIESETVDMSSLVTSFMGVGESEDGGDGEDVSGRDEDRVYANAVIYDMMNAANSIETNKNNLTRFKKFLDTNEGIKENASAVQYVYDTDLKILVKNKNGEPVKTDMLSMMDKVYGEMGISFGSMMGNSEIKSFYSGYDVWEQLLTGTNGEQINPLLYEQYDLVYGEWPDSYDEVVLLVSEKNELSDLVLYSLGLQTADEIAERMKSSMDKEQVDTASLGSWSYEELCGIEMRLLLTPDCYSKQGEHYVDLSESEAGVSYLFGSEKAVPIKISGIIRPNEDAVAGMLGGSIAYTEALTDYIIGKTAENQLVKAQLADSTVDVISGLPFETEASAPTDAEKAEKFKTYLNSLDEKGKAELFTELASIAPDQELEKAEKEFFAQNDREAIVSMMTQSYLEQMGTDDAASVEEYVRGLDDETLFGYVSKGIRAQAAQQYAAAVKQNLSAVPDGQKAAMLEGQLQKYTEAQLAQLCDSYAPAEYSERKDADEVLELLGFVDKDAPSSVNIYAATFANKDAISQLISEYNASLSEDEEDDVINYTDYVALMMSSVSTVISAISYVLIAFVAISLVVSSIMIGIITYISVLERTKEIGILRAIGASKKDISRVFNAETLIVGFAAGLFGIGITLLLLIPINIILHAATGIAILSAVLPVGGAIILVIISMVLTFIAGLVPSKIAARKDPVVALRTE